VYGSLRERAKSLVNELKRDGIHRAYIEGNDEMMDILRLTCIEAGIQLLDSPNGIVLKVVGQEYGVIKKHNKEREE
jgi:hypothetical protein